MGLLALGTPLEWPDAKKEADHVRKWGIEQLLALWNRSRNKRGEALIWGDEIEYLVVSVDDNSKTARLSLRQADILVALKAAADAQAEPAGIFHPEFGRFMLESTPAKPWTGGLKDLARVEANMKLRREFARAHMAEDEFPVTITTFPRLGLGDYITPQYPPSGEKLRSQFVPDEIANPHIRFPTLAANIRARRGRKVQVNVPVFRDKETKWPWTDPTVDYSLTGWPEDDDVRTGGAVKPNHIHMDAMAFGMGSCCLQLTFQATHVCEARKMYDQLIPLGPVLLALTAATPIYKGFLADTDVRWNQIGAAVDDRTAEELGEVELSKNRWRIPKSRYGSNSTYISLDQRLRPEYQDPDLIVDEDIKARLLEGGMDPLLATHFAHLFIRDPLVVFSEDLQELDVTKTDHFENLQSTNWQHVRFKPPPAGEGEDVPGWRVEFRPMEVQFTDFENAAFSVFMVLLLRAILAFDLNLYLPIRRVDENMETAHRRDAVLDQKFWFRRRVFPSNVPTEPAEPVECKEGVAEGRAGSPEQALYNKVEEEYCLMTIDEIVNGTKGRWGPASVDSPDCLSRHEAFPGLVGLVESYLESVEMEGPARQTVETYLSLVRARASGRAWTNARWMRHFVSEHEQYGRDSAVGERVSYDMIKAIEEMSRCQPDEAGGLGREMFEGVL